PPHRRVDRERKREVRRETVLREARVVDETRLHHVPAHRALESAEDEDPRELPRQLARDPSARSEPHERQQEGGADETSEEPVYVLPPEDALEPVEVHVRVHLAE